MDRYELIAPCHFGLEAVLKAEITALGLEIVKVEDGRVTFCGDASAVARANIFLRTAERVLWKIGEFSAETFEELFQKTAALPWEEIIPADGRFWVTKATSVKSKLFSTSDIQSIMKKAIVERLKQKYHISWFPETGNEYPIRVSVLKDTFLIGIDTSGESLHKRGYRKLVGKAPISETLAAALISLTPWNESRILVDPFCGSGTIPIEAAMIGRNIAPGVARTFRAETYRDRIPEAVWKAARAEARDLEKHDGSLQIQGYDIDREAISIARQNAAAAGVGNDIHFQVRAVKELHHPKKYGFVITNPPYGERLEDRKDLPELYGQIGEAYRGLDSWSMFLITSYEDAEKYIGRKADRNRKIYNGMIKTYFYQFLGPKPPKAGAPKSAGNGADGNGEAGRHSGEKQ
ncbi:MAG: class I SAM-dependent RNA methyltransferase [Lachnospiraceae bacterium]|nr:class I SAM-dependent RNA methyltransferase [Lachnospiraceae bacterium]MBO4767686.1 class I SAM-dependent RNA methyltransferase [Lachnospiraceae bacterium]